MCQQGGCHCRRSNLKAVGCVGEGVGVGEEGKELFIYMDLKCDLITFFDSNEFISSLWGQKAKSRRAIASAHHTLLLFSVYFSGSQVFVHEDWQVIEY